MLKKICAIGKEKYIIRFDWTLVRSARAEKNNYWI